MNATEPATPASTADASAEKAVQAERAHAARVRALATDPVKPVIDAQPAPQRSGVGALLAGGVLAAVIGAGATIVALPYLPPQILGLLAQPDNSVATTLNEQARKIADMEQQIQALSNRPDTAPVAADTSGIQPMLDETSAQLRGLAGRIDVLERRPAPVATVAPMDPNIHTEIETLKSQIGALSTENISARVNAAADQAETRLRQSETQSTQLQAKAVETARKAIEQSLIARLATAFDAGMPLAPVTKELQDAGLTVPDVLLSQVPTLHTLQVDFPETARLALAASRRSEAANGGMWQRLEALVKTQLGARSVTPQSGDGADAVLSRAAAAIDVGDTARAVEELKSLPQAGQDVISGWVALAQARLTAGAAIADLSASTR